MAPSLEVAISKSLPGFTLDASFSAGSTPVGLLGASGAGKSLILRCIAGLTKPDSGKIVLDGGVLFDAATGAYQPPRNRRIGLMFQQYALFPHLTVRQNVEFGLKHLAPRERARRTDEQIAAMRLAEFERRRPAQLSGGQQQRVALARALAPAPAALLLDEPFSALDTHLRSELERQLRESLQRHSGVTLIVSHNLEELYRLCGEFVVLEKGAVIARGSRGHIFGRPPNRTTARLTGCKNFSRARPLSDHRIEATDWSCSLQVTQPIPKSVAHVAIRANHVELDAPSGIAGPEPNCFPVRSSGAVEGPFRVTVYLLVEGAAPAGSDCHFQAELPRPKWEFLRSQPQPWVARLHPDRIFLLPD